MSSQIVINDPKMAPYFKTLNLAWLTKYFVVEPIDEQVLSHPEQLIEKGGFVFYLLHNEDVVGCCALKHHDNNCFELTKMAVDEAFQGLGLGKKLMQACLKQFDEIGGDFLYLETNSQLTTAIKLYEQFNFKACDCPFDTPYQRADYYMEWQGN